MSNSLEKLNEIAASLLAGDEVDSISVRDFLWWWYAERRSHWTVWKIRKELSEAGLVTVPDFQDTYLDSHIWFRLTESYDEQQADVVEDDEETDSPLPVEDPTYRIRKLAAANQGIVYVSPDASLSEIVTIMMERDFSQLPVMTSDRDVKGIVTWQSIGARLSLNLQDDLRARHFMEKPQIVNDSDSIFEVIDQIVRHDSVIVRSTDQKISGIITASDLSLQFRQLSESFLILSEIENTIRLLIESRFTVEEMSSCRDPLDNSREVSSAADLTFGEYVRLLEDRDRWDRFSIPIDRKKFCESLEKVRSIRNDVMHFDPDGIPEDDLQKLRDFSRFLRKIKSIIS